MRRELARRGSCATAAAAAANPKLTAIGLASLDLRVSLLAWLAFRMRPRLSHRKRN